MLGSKSRHAGRRACLTAVLYPVPRRRDGAASTAHGSSLFPRGCPRGAASQPIALACVVACLPRAPRSMLWLCTCAATRSTHTAQRRVAAAAQLQPVLNSAAGCFHHTPRPVKRLRACRALPCTAGARLRSLPAAPRATDAPCAQRYDAVLLQHEYCIYGGYRGEYVVELLRHAAHAVPIITTLHTVERVPSPMVQHALQQLLQHSVALTALSPSGCRNVGAWHDIVGTSVCALGRRILIAVALGMRASPTQCLHVPHGVPLLPLCRKHPLKRALGTASRFVIMCGGLLSPPKGVELIIKVCLLRSRLSHRSALADGSLAPGNAARCRGSSERASGCCRSSASVAWSGLLEPVDRFSYFARRE